MKGETAMPSKRESKRYRKDGSYIRPEDRTGVGAWDEYEIRDALSTLATAAKIRKNPALLRACQAEARKQVLAAQASAAALGSPAKKKPRSK